MKKLIKSTLKKRFMYFPFIVFLSFIFLCKSYFMTITVELKQYHVITYPKEYHVITAPPDSMDDDMAKLLIFYEKNPASAAPPRDGYLEDYRAFQWCPPDYRKDNLSIINEDDGDYTDLDCEELFSGQNRTLIDKAKEWKSPCSFDDTAMINFTGDCDKLRKSFPFRWPKSDESQTSNFPIAYVLLVAEYAEQVVRLLQSIYRPWNLYCIAYDNDTSFEFKQNIHNVNGCFDNIILPKQLINVNWGGFSILNSVVNCMRVLNGHKNAWRYVQILSWNDVPLKTNAETVRIMQIFNGSQDAELQEGQPDRFRQYFVDGFYDYNKSSAKKQLPPGNLHVYKGSMSATLSREFVNFTLTNRLAKAYYKWSKTTWAPEEQYFPTLVHNLHTGVPGGFPGTCLPYYQFDNKQKLYVSRYQVWEGNCAGQLVSSSCVFGVGDLPKLYKRHDLIAHKLYLYFQPATYYCMSKLHHSRTFNSSNYADFFNLTFYQQLPAVRYHHTKNKMNFRC